MKIRLISDTHFDKGLNGINDSNKPLKNSFGYYFKKELEKEKECITLIAGDVASSLTNTKIFLNQFFKNQTVYFIAGNHFCYNKEGKTISELIKEYKKDEELKQNNWYFLENSWEWIKGTNQQWAIIGSIFYTDYSLPVTLEQYNNGNIYWNNMMKLYGLQVDEYKPIKKLSKKMVVQYNMNEAEHYLNDFRWGKMEKNKNITPKDYLEMNKKAKQKIKECHDEIISINPNAKIILLTHHGLSPKCTDDRYLSSPITSSYVSDCEKWVVDNLPYVKLIHSGHCHTTKDFKLQNGTRYIVNACGYIHKGEPFREENKFNPNLIIDL